MTFPEHGLSIKQVEILQTTFLGEFSRPTPLKNVRTKLIEYFNKPNKNVRRTTFAFKAFWETEFKDELVSGIPQAGNTFEICFDDKGLIHFSYSGPDFGNDAELVDWKEWSAGDKKHEKTESGYRIYAFNKLTEFFDTVFGDKYVSKATALVFEKLPDNI